MLRIKNPPQNSYFAEQIYQAAQREEPAAVKALTELVIVYDSFIGAIALIWNASGSIFLVGGIVSKMTGWMAKACFLNAFLE